MPAGDASAFGPRTIVVTPDNNFRGVAVTARNGSDIAAVGIGAGFAGTAAVSLAGSIDVLTVNTTALIGASAHINCNATCEDNVAGAGVAQRVVVAANNNLYELGVAGSLAIAGGAGIAVPVEVRVINLTTDASIADGAFVDAVDDVKVLAGAKDSIVSVVVEAGGGTVGVAGSVGVTILNVTTKASAPATGSRPAAMCSSTRRTTPSSTHPIGIAGGFVGVGATRSAWPR